jgi:hypothetical protein
VLQHLEQENDEVFNQLWLDVVDFVMGSESLPGGSGVVGALVKVRGLHIYRRTISIWMASSSTMITRTLIASKLKEKLKLDSLYFGLHTDLEQSSEQRKEKRLEQLPAVMPQKPVATAREPPISWRSRPTQPVDVQVKSWRRK